jgi:hypothetical protein
MFLPRNIFSCSATLSTLAKTRKKEMITFLEPIQGVYLKALELYVTDKEDTFMRNVKLAENWYKLQIKVSLFSSPSHSFSSTSSNTFCNSSTSSTP